MRSPEEIAAAANAAGIKGQAAFLVWASSLDIECSEYDAVGIELYGDEHILRYDTNLGWLHACPGGCS